MHTFDANDQAIAMSRLWTENDIPVQPLPPLLVSTPSPVYPALYPQVKDERVSVHVPPSEEAMQLEAPVEHSSTTATENGKALDPFT